MKLFFLSYVHILSGVFSLPSRCQKMKKYERLHCIYCIVLYLFLIRNGKKCVMNVLDITRKVFLFRKHYFRHKLLTLWKELPRYCSWLFTLEWRRGEKEAGCMRPFYFYSEKGKGTLGWIENAKLDRNCFFHNFLQGFNILAQCEFIIPSVRIRQPWKKYVTNIGHKSQTGLFWQNIYFLCRFSFLL